MLNSAHAVTCQIFFQFLLSMLLLGSAVFLLIISFWTQNSWFLLLYHFRRSFGFSFAHGKGKLWAVCRLWDCKNRTHSISWLNVVEGIPNQGLVFLLARLGFSVFLCSGCMYVLFTCFWLSLPVQSSAQKDSSRKWRVMCQVGHLNSTHSLTKTLTFLDKVFVLVNKISLVVCVSCLLW